MTEERTGKCPVKMFGGVVCGRDICQPDGTKCIFHSAREDKDCELFRKKLSEIFACKNPEMYDMCGFIFPKDLGWFPLPQKVLVPLALRGARFLGDCNVPAVDFDAVDFVGVKFKGKTSFVGSTFTDSVAFSKAVFSGKAIFDRCEFQDDARFLGTTFVKDVSFRGSRLRRNGFLYFDTRAGDGTIIKVFQAEADFRGLGTASDTEVQFRGTDLSKCRLVGTDLSRFQFLGVDWPRELRWPGTWLKRIWPLKLLVTRLGWFDPRAAYDEELARKEASTAGKLDRAASVPYRRTSVWGPVRELYRQLQRNYMENFRYIEAGDFYVGEQEAIRQDSPKWYKFLCLNNMYNVFSHYGQSVALPLSWLIIVLLLFPFFLLPYDFFSMTDLLIVICMWGTSNDVLPLWDDYWRAFAENLLIVTRQGNAPPEYLAELFPQVLLTVESILVVVLVTFFVLALSRRFRRKSF